MIATKKTNHHKSSKEEILKTTVINVKEVNVQVLYTCFQSTFSWLRRTNNNNLLQEDKKRCSWRRYEKN